MITYYWDGGTPVAHTVRDISSGGLYVLTAQRWYRGTLLLMSLQRTDSTGDGSEEGVSVWAEAVRSGPDGAGFSFVLPQARSSLQAGSIPSDAADKKTVERFVQRLRADTGAALIEYILLLPLLLLLIVNTVNFGGFFYAWIAVANAARAGADYAVMGKSSVGAPGVPSVAQISSLITTDISSLPNRASLSVNICQNNGGTVSALAGTCSSVPSDPEPTTYVLTTIDVTYTYQPFISAGFKFPNLNIYATIPPTTIHRRAVMRLIQ